jgi:hypothetical protein
MNPVIVRRQYRFNIKLPQPTPQSTSIAARLQSMHRNNEHHMRRRGARHQTICLGTPFNPFDDACITSRRICFFAARVRHAWSQDGQAIIWRWPVILHSIQDPENNR